MGTIRAWSPVLVGVCCALLVLSACAAPPLPSVHIAPTATPFAADVTSVPSTLTPTETLDNASEDAPVEETDALTRAIVNVRIRGFSTQRALRLCELPQTITYQNRVRVYCLHPETISFDQMVTALGEVMNDRFGLRDADGNELAYDSNRRCEFNLCYAHIWYDKQNFQNAYALLRLYPLEASGKQVAPLLEVKPNGDPKILTDWQVVLVEQRTGEIVQMLPSPFVRMARSDTIAFNAGSGYFEVLDRSGRLPRPTGKRLGLPFGLEQVAELAALVQEVALYNFNRADVAYYENALRWLHENMPDWYDYFLAQRPLEIYRDASLPFVSDGICCRTRNGDSTFGRIRFRDGLANWTSDSFPGAAHDALARWSFLTLLIHEATHVRDLRLRRFELTAMPGGMRDCVMHISTDEIEVLFSQHASQIRISADDSTQREYVKTIQEFYDDVENRVLPEKQKTCGDFYKPSFDGLMP